MMADRIAYDLSSPLFSILRKNPGTWEFQSPSSETMGKGLKNTVLPFSPFKNEASSILVNSSPTETRTTLMFRFNLWQYYHFWRTSPPFSQPSFLPKFLQTIIRPFYSCPNPYHVET